MLGYRATVRETMTLPPLLCLFIDHSSGLTFVMCLHTPWHLISNTIEHKSKKSIVFYLHGKVIRMGLDEQLVQPASGLVTYYISQPVREGERWGNISLKWWHFHDILQLQMYYLYISDIFYLKNSRKFITFFPRAVVPSEILSCYYIIGTEQNKSIFFLKSKYNVSTFLLCMQQIV